MRELALTGLTNRKYDEGIKSAPYTNYRKFD
jgi:hypothetical protein